MPRRSRQAAAATRSQIVEHAVDVASTHGLEGLTIGRLADDIGMSKSGLIGHFGTREALQLAALDRAIERFREEVWDRVAAQPEGVVRLRALADAWIAHLERGVFPGGCFLTAASLEFDDRPGPVRDRVAETMRLWLRVVARDARVAIARGDLPPHPEPEQLAFELNALVMAANWGARLHRDEEAFARARIAVIRLLGGRGAS
ncbi:MAG TPA: TetR/AcrR family transcriptional regulator [Solirubrobacteraceae bacterium]|nr:TetR/AcrR family transcriptional regulator [Solirubrobacteraceae bacterium]